jgi:hypothetical protein
VKKIALGRTKPGWDPSDLPFSHSGIADNKRTTFVDEAGPSPTTLHGFPCLVPSSLVYHNIPSNGEPVSFSAARLCEAGAKAQTHRVCSRKPLSVASHPAILRTSTGQEVQGGGATTGPGPENKRIERLTGERVETPVGKEQAPRHRTQ